MFDIFENFATDEKKEVEGVKMPLTKDAGLIVARMNNERYLSRFAEEYEKHKDILDRENEEARELDRQITLQIYAETILVGFYGDLAFKGKPLGEYTVEKAKQLLEVKDLRLKVIEFAQKRDNFLLSTEDAAVKK
jgi:hypothetical protein